MNNAYNVVMVPTGVPTLINSLEVPARGGYSLKGLIVWSAANYDIQVVLNVETIAGGKITGTCPTLFLDFSSSPFGIGSFDIVSVIATQDPDLTPPGSYPVYSTLLIEQL